MSRFLPKFNDLQLEKLSEISANLGLVFFASLVMPIFLAKVLDIFALLMGLVSSLAFWILSLMLLKRG